MEKKLSKAARYAASRVEPWTEILQEGDKGTPLQAQVSARGNLVIGYDASVDESEGCISPEQALSLARWIVETFGD